MATSSRHDDILIHAVTQDDIDFLPACYLPRKMQVGAITFHFILSIMNYNINYLYIVVWGLSRLL